jgi:hypothetical protein
MPRDRGSRETPAAAVLCTGVPPASLMNPRLAIAAQGMRSPPCGWRRSSNIRVTAAAGLGCRPCGVRSVAPAAAKFLPAYCAAFARSSSQYRKFVV